MTLIKLAEYLGEGTVGFAVLLIIPAVIVLLNMESERKHHFTTLLENHFLDRLAALANRRDK